VQSGVLEIHTWGSRRDRLDRPDRVIFDLDPAPNVGWAAVVWAARAVRERLGELGLESWVKTTGGKGVHVVAPLTRRHDWDVVHGFSRAVAEALEKEHPERLLSRASKAERSGRVFVDYLRNSWSASAVAAYSTRARPGAPVATPVGWDELARLGGGAAFTVATLPARLKSRRADPWAGYRTARQSLTKAALRAVGVE
jgi:bifunctional non-homologous end joining protein LigD